MDTPETVDPRKPVQCFGREASAQAKTILSGQSVYLETDPSQDTVDKYGRTLASTSTGRVATPWELVAIESFAAGPAAVRGVEEALSRSRLAGPSA